MQLLRQTFYFLRHGETDWNRIGLVQGQVNMPLERHRSCPGARRP